MSKPQQTQETLQQTCGLCHIPFRLDELNGRLIGRGWMHGKPCIFCPDCADRLEEQGRVTPKVVD